MSAAALARPLGPSPGPSRPACSSLLLREGRVACTNLLAALLLAGSFTQRPARAPLGQYDRLELVCFLGRTGALGLIALFVRLAARLRSRRKRTLSTRTPTAQRYVTSYSPHAISKAARVRSVLLGRYGGGQKEDDRHEGEVDELDRLQGGL